MIFWYQFKFLISRVTILLSIIIFVSISILIHMMFNRQMTYTNELIQFYDERTNEAIGIITEYTPLDDMYRFYDVNRVYFHTGFNEDGSTTTNGFTGVVIQEIFDTNYTNLSYYNENTVIEGQYKTLAHNEMVISKDISMKKGCPSR